MVVQPKVRGFICTTAHPKGCEKNVLNQIEYVKSKNKINGAKNVLVIGSSTGYGLASRITAAYSCGAKTLGISFEREASGNRTATAGFYNTAAFEKQAKKDGLYAKSIIGDAFSLEIKKQASETIKSDMGKIDMLIYSLASPRRTTHEGETFSSVIKPVGKPFISKTIDLNTNKVTNVTIEPATEEEVNATVKVMGGEDWQLWVNFLRDENLLSDDFLTIAYSYIGPELTHPIYLNGTIGMAKKHLKETADSLTNQLKNINGKAYVSVNKALVTQASSAIPVVPLYITMLYKIMKEKGIHEGCIEQMYRLFADRLYAQKIATDNDGFIRIDDLEMRPDIQDYINSAWDKIEDSNLSEYADIDDYWDNFYNLFGFKFEGVDYSEDVEV